MTPSFRRNSRIFPVLALEAEGLDNTEWKNNFLKSWRGTLVWLSLLTIVGKEGAHVVKAED
jgi:hypothetical protein